MAGKARVVSGKTEYCGLGDSVQESAITTPIEKRVWVPCRKQKGITLG